MDTSAKLWSVETGIEQCTLTVSWGEEEWEGGGEKEWGGEGVGGRRSWGDKEWGEKELGR